MNSPPRTVLVTGSNRGLGLEFVRQLTSLPSSPSCIIATCRKPDNAVALKKIASKHSSVHILQLGSFKDVPGFGGGGKPEYPVKTPTYDQYLATALHGIQTLQLRGGGLMVECLNTLNTRPPRHPYFSKFNVQHYEDVTDRENVGRVKEKVGLILQGRGLNLLLNNAGVGPGGDLYDVTEDIMMNTFKTNVVAPLLITQAFLPYLKTAAKTTGGAGLSWRRSAVINISSRLASIETNDEYLLGRYPYKTSKAALNMVSKNLSVDLRGDGILAVSLSPGSVRTDMGVASAPLLPHQSVEMMLRVISGLNDQDSGTFLNFTGDLIPW